MSEWQTKNLSFNGLDPILAAIDALDAGGQIIQPFVSATATVLDIVAALQQGIDVQAQAIDAAFEVALAALEDLTAQSAGHLMFVPPIAPFSRQPATPRVPLQGLENIAYVRMVRGVSSELVADGGNYGMYRKFVESLFDRGDFSRPEYSPDAYVGGGVILFGAESFAEIISGMLSVSALFGDAVSLPVDNYQLPVPQNIKARPVATMKRSVVNGFEVVTDSISGDEPEESQGFVPVLSRPSLPEFVSAKVFWDPPKTVLFDVLFGSLTYTIRSWHVFVKPHEKIKAGEEITQYEVASFEVTPSNFSDEQKREFENAVVVGDVSGLILQKLRPGTTYYISAAYTVDVEDRRAEQVVPIVPTWETLSGQVRFRGEDRLSFTRFTEGTPPDWLAISSPLAAFPQVQQTLNEVRAAVELYQTAFADRSNTLSDAAAKLRDVLEGLQLRQDALSNLVERFLSTLENIDVGVWTTTFSGQGGTPFLVKTMGDLLLDPQTVNRPPFDDGDEALSALFFVTGAETPGAVQAFVDLLSLFLGEPDGGFDVLADLQRSDPPGDDADADEDATEDQTRTLTELGLRDEDC